MFRISIEIVMVLTLVLVGCATGCTTVSTTQSTTADPGSRHGSAGPNEVLRGLSPHDAVVATEQAFAKSMADRDFSAFKSFLSDEAIFMSGPMPLRGKQRVAAAWEPYFESPDAPFSWEPEHVVVLDSEGLAFSSGPVSNPNGVVTGIFNSVWRRDTDGAWRIVFDKGGCACN